MEDMEESLSGIGGVGGGGRWRGMEWREDQGRWLVWSEPRVCPATSLRRFMDVDEMQASDAALSLSVSVQVGAQYKFPNAVSCSPHWQKDVFAKSCTFLEFCDYSASSSSFKA